jgi:hypothetical protein
LDFGQFFSAVSEFSAFKLCFVVWYIDQNEMKEQVLIDRDLLIVVVAEVMIAMSIIPQSNCEVAIGVVA